MQLLIIGDGGYPLLTCLMRPYNFFQNLMQSQKMFNKTFSSARVISERGLGILKAWGRSLLKHLDANIENVSSIIITCAVFHNICQFSGINYVEIISRTTIMEQHIRKQRCSNNGNLDPNANNIKLLVENYLQDD